MIKTLQMLFRRKKTLAFPENSQFKLNQKVFISNTHEEKDGYVGVGIICGYAGKKVSYWDFTNTPVNCFFIKTENGGVITRGLGRIQDLKEYLEVMDYHIKNWERMGCKDGDKGFTNFDLYKIEHQVLKDQHLTQ
jgi:hypothetical protein